MIFKKIQFVTTTIVPYPPINLLYFLPNVTDEQICTGNGHLYEMKKFNEQMVVLKKVRLSKTGDLRLSIVLCLHGELQLMLLQPTIKPLFLRIF